jgi:hypothetical protein
MRFKEDLLNRARHHLRLATLHRGLRDVTAEIVNVREALAAAGSHPAAIGTTEEDLLEILRVGHLAEARMLFDFTAESRLSLLEKDFFFSELVAQVVKAVTATTPTRPTVREAPLTTASADEAPVDDAAAASVLAEHDLSSKDGFVHWDAARASGEFQGIDADDLAGLNFDAIAASLPPPDSSDESAPPAEPTLLVRLGHEGNGDDPELYIEIGIEDCYEIVPVAAPPADLHVEAPETVRYCMRFFGEKDAIALGLIPAPVAPPEEITLLTKPKRREPPPLPKCFSEAASNDV